MNAAALALFVVLAAWVFCVLASVFHWHAAITGPCAGILVVPLVACAVWLNRAASNSEDEEKP